jgi:Icc-related predicted phosphoesterase
MKILAIGDFHGKFPEKLKRGAKKADLVLCTGDYVDAEKIRKLVFKNWKNKSWIDAVGKKKAKKLEKECFNSGLRILRELDSIGKKVFVIFGNTDFYKRDAYLEPKDISPGYFDDIIRKSKNLSLVDRSKRKFKDIEIIGHGGYLDITDWIKHPIDKEKKKQKIRFARYNDYKKKLFRLFSRKKPKNFIFLTHYTPYKIFDKVKIKKSPIYGRHAGFEPYNQVIKKYQPLLAICGHMHEYQGMKKLGKTTIIATGPAYEGKAALIDIEGKKIKSIKFLR